MMKITTFGFAINADPSQIDQCLVPALLAHEQSLSNLNWVDNIYPKEGDRSNTLAKSKLLNYLVFYKTHTICIIAASDLGITTCLETYDQGHSILFSENPPTTVYDEQNLHNRYVLIDHNNNKHESFPTLNLSQTNLKKLNAIYIDLNSFLKNNIQHIYEIIGRTQPQILYLYGLKSKDIDKGIEVISKLTQALKSNSSSDL